MKDFILFLLLAIAILFSYGVVMRLLNNLVQLHAANKFRTDKNLDLILVIITCLLWSMLIVYWF